MTEDLTGGKWCFLQGGGAKLEVRPPSKHTMHKQTKEKHL